jgi:hypothetical protein
MMCFLLLTVGDRPDMKSTADRATAGCWPITLFMRWTALKPALLMR